TVHTGNATRLLVFGARFDQQGRPWLRVQLPIRPNERAGWIRADETRIESTDVFIRVRLEARTISVYRAGRLWSRSRAVIGAPKTPTPRGLFAIYETAYQGGSKGFLGSWALHLTAFSNVLDNYGGGPGRAAIHGRGPESIKEAALGEAKSHGCVRVPNSFVEWLRTRAPAGTPVQITLR
ncbi:MAG: L,D-transpeptidase, partial [Solirubrobacteraceae bacterium]|nr:L,D-transpeptidase [Solirubrobacteraceae bacterium]